MKTLGRVIGFVGLAGLVLMGSSAVAAQSTGGVCAACLVVRMRGAELAQALTSSRRLDGLPIVIQIDSDLKDVAFLVAALRERGASTGLEVSAFASPIDVATLKQLDILLLNVDGGGEHPGLTEQMFELRTGITAARSARPDLSIGLSGSRAAIGAFVGGGLSGYLDFVLLSGEEPAADLGFLPVWRDISVGSGREALEATRTISAERIVVDLLPQGRPDDFLSGIAGFRGSAWADALPDAAVLPEAFSAEVFVRGNRQLTVEEIIARHQAAAVRQAAVIESTISSGTQVLSFEVPGFAAPVAVTADTVMFRAPEILEIEQRNIRINGAQVAGGFGRGVPRLPIVEPERVSAPPLALTLNDDYAYRLAGTERLEGHQCYVVEFTPRSAGRSLFRGRAWVDAETFGLVRTEAAQTELHGPVTASQQRDDFVMLTERGTAIWVLKRSEVHQLYDGAGHRTPIHRVLQLDAHEVNPIDFGARRREAHASSSVLLRDTPNGFKYLQRTQGRTAGPEASRVVASGAQPVRTIVFGAIIDPNISRPLPFAGFSYLDTNVFNSGGQINAFFGGAYGQLSWAFPSLAGTRWQLAGTAFGTLAEYHDRSFRNGAEQYDENIRQRPARMSVALSRSMTPTARLRLAYELEYTRFRPAESTADTFQMPISPLVNGARVELELQRGPWSGSIWWNPAERVRWRPWGVGVGTSTSSVQESQRLQRFGVTARRSFVLSPRTVGRVEASWMGGDNLDRFSRYSVGMFDNSLRGYPTASLRYDWGALFKSALSWNVGNRLQFDGFVDSAILRDPGFGPHAKGYAGVGGGIELPLPSGILLTAEWGYGIQARNRAGGAGTHVVRVTGYRMF